MPASVMGLTMYWCSSCIRASHVALEAAAQHLLQATGQALHSSSPSARPRAAARQDKSLLILGQIATSDHHKLPCFGCHLQALMLSLYLAPLTSVPHQQCTLWACLNDATVPPDSEAYQSPWVIHCLTPSSTAGDMSKDLVFAVSP